MAKLTSAGVRSITAPGLHGDGGTLFLAVAKAGSKSWIQRITIDGRRHDLGLGGFPVISLAKARERAMANRLAVAEGRNPLAEKRRARTPTFRKAALATFEANRPRWRDGKTARNWMQSAAAIKTRILIQIVAPHDSRVPRKSVARWAR